MATMMRDLMLHGNAVFEISDPPDLIRAAAWEVYGKRSIRYRLTHVYPDGQTDRNLPQAAVCHVLVNANRDMPWMGRSPFESSILAPVERSMLEQALLVSKRILSLPGPDVKPETQHADREGYKSELEQGLKQQGYTLVQSKTVRGTDQPVHVITLRLEPDQHALELRSQLVQEIYESIGYPAILRSEAPPGAGSQRCTCRVD